MRRLLCCALLVAAACGHKDNGSSGSAGTGDDKPPKPAKPHGPEGQPRPQDKLTVTVDGKPVKMATALAWKTSRGDIELTASSLPVSCDQVTGTMREIYPDEVTFTLREARQLQPDGSYGLAITSAYFDAMTQSENVPTTGSGDGREGASTTLDLDFQLDGTSKQKLAVKGTLDALGCPAQMPPPPKKSPGEQPAFMTIAGKKQIVHNAMLRDVDTAPKLVLTSGGETCDRNSDEVVGNFQVELMWFDKTNPDVRQIELSGALLPTLNDQTYDHKAITVTPAPPMTITQIKIDADIKVNKYPVLIKGTVTPQVCK
jgi:hypothetical protein